VQLFEVWLIVVIFKGKTESSDDSNDDDRDEKGNENSLT
jgi:hypothetical protein